MEVLQVVNVEMYFDDSLGLVIKGFHISNDQSSQSIL